MGTKSWKFSKLKVAGFFVFSQTAEQKDKEDASFKCCDAGIRYRTRLFIWQEFEGGIKIIRVQ